MANKEARMLVLSRKEGETVLIGPDGQFITVRVISISKNRVRLGIVAPQDQKVLRGEIAANGTGRFRKQQESK